MENLSLTEVKKSLSLTAQLVLSTSSILDLSTQTYTYNTILALDFLCQTPNDLLEGTPA